jgi:16S rRNA (guanine966-N2)-methyltransferase
VRIISGSARGRRITVPPGEAIRPTTDRVREAVFNALFSAGALDDPADRVAVDLFAGTGAFGLEALSRGIGKVTFVDRSRLATDAITAHLEQFGFTDGAAVVRSDALGWLSSARPEQIDLVFCDPPYRFESWPQLLELLRVNLRPKVLVAESDSEVDLGPGWAEFKTARYASTVVQIARLDEAASELDSEGA